MKKYIILIVFILFLNNNAKGFDSLLTTVRMNNAIEHIKADSLFQAHLIKNCSNELTFCIDDSTTYPIIQWEIFFELYPEYSKKHVFDLWQKIKNTEAFYHCRKSINHTKNNEIKGCNYNLTLMEFEPIPHLWGLYIHPLNCTSSRSMMVIYLLFDINDNVIQSVSMKWEISE